LRVHLTSDICRPFCIGRFGGPLALLVAESFWEMSLI